MRLATKRQAFLCANIQDHGEMAEGFLDLL
jgi:hypothetical protein